MDLEKEKEELHVDRKLDTSWSNAGQVSLVIYSKEALLAEEAEEHIGHMSTIGKITYVLVIKEAK